MSNEIYAKQRDAKESMREDTDSDIFFQRYPLSTETVAKLESIKKAMKDNIAQANPMWKLIAEEDEEKSSISEESDNDDEVNTSNSQAISSQSILESSTQFYFTQVEKTIEPDKSVAALSQKYDILESLCEGLERNNGRLDFDQLKNVSHEDLIALVNDLAEKLSPKGIYNLCQSMNDMSIEQTMRYLNVLCTHLLLPKIIELEEPSRLLSSAISECVRKFPDEIRQYIFVPILNTELKDTTLITTIVNTYDSQKKAGLIQEFVTFVKELKLWHIPLLQCLVSVRFDDETIGKIIKLFSGKALCYSKDKNFGKLILTFLKINTTLSEEQKSIMFEIAAINETLFKKSIENILKT